MGKKTAILKYALLPGFKPRIQAIFLTGFQYVPYFIALVYQAVRLLPANHPYLNVANLGRYGVRHVIAEAANNLVISRKNIDQVILFFSVMVGIATVFVQLCLLGVGAFFQPALAQGISMFVTPTATQATDLAGMMMDMVFGVPGVFNSCVSTAAVCADLDGNPITAGAANDVASPLSDSAYNFFPFPLQQGLHNMFLLYNTGLLVVAAFILGYFIITVLLETAQSGTPFGKRFNKVWAPLRLVAAFGLLIPMSFGLNASQYIVLYAAKFGSGFATNGWNLFNETLNGSYLGATENLVSRPNIPELDTLLQFFYVARACYEGETASSGGKTKIDPYLVKGPIGPENKLKITAQTSYDSLLKFADKSTIVTISFGQFRDDAPEGEKSKYGLNKGFVKPICGQIKFNLTDPRIPGANTQPEPGPATLQRAYWELIKDLWFKKAGTESVGSENFPQNLVKKYGDWDPRDSKAEEPDDEFKAALTQYYTDKISAAIDEAVQQQRDSGSWEVPEALRRTGWAGAGIWYNRVAELNGPVTTAAFNIPTVAKYPELMEYVRERKQQNDQNVAPDDVFNPKLADGKSVEMKRPVDVKLAPIYDKAYTFWETEGVSRGTKNDRTGNVIVDAINLLLGTDGLFSMRRNTDVHPLAQLVGLGRSMVESSIRNMAGAAIGTILQPVAGKMAGMIAGLFITIAMIGLTVGFVMFYIVPFLPFIYFFFAFAGWIKGIFEAMVGAPLWALAHIRIDGEGFAGQAAGQGYFLIFEIFLRPILTVFGLLASISIFAALVMTLNETFDLVLSNLTGFDQTCEQTNCGPTQMEYYRGAIDQFFFTVVYAVLVYIMAMASFKLIDQIPANILRWMGSAAAAFNDKRGDMAEGLVGTASIGAQQTLQYLGGGLKGFTR